jgi:CRP-like cAMP-binding protein
MPPCSTTNVREIKMPSTNASTGFANAQLFHGLTADELTTLERAAHPRHYDAGATILREGEGGIAFFVITSGKVVVSRSGSDGQQHEIRTIGPGGAFGEMALFSDRPRAATVTAVEATDCAALHRFEFLDVLRRNPEVALRMLDSLAIRLDEASALI